MKVFIIYSGKGGVGKTTTTANIAKALVKQKKKVFILDGDVNTPSMPIIFKDKNPNEYLKIDSLGYNNKSMIYITDSSIRAYLSDAIDAINEFKPDYVLIDTPPSITDVHINLLNKIKPSGMIIVTQPNALSISDINRTVLFFKDRKVNIIGIVENMCEGSEKNDYSFEVLESIPFEKGFDGEKVYEKNKSKYNKIVSYLKNYDAVLLKNQKRQLYDESIDIEDVNSLSLNQKDDLKFINLKTWDYVSDLIQEMESPLFPCRMIQELTTERIGRLLKNFEHDDEAYFMITKAPSTEIDLLPGEIGKCTLSTSKAAYHTPCVKYQTENGEVTLFAYEVLPIKYTDLIMYLYQENYIITKSGRYIPPIETLEQCDNAYGHRVGFKDGWQKYYEEIKNGVVKKIQTSVEHEQLSQHINNKKSRKQKTIGDLHNKKYNPYLNGTY